MSWKPGASTSRARSRTRNVCNSYCTRVCALQSRVRVLVRVCLRPSDVDEHRLARQQTELRLADEAHRLRRRRQADDQHVRSREQRVQLRAASAEHLCSSQAPRSTLRHVCTTTSVCAARMHSLGASTACDGPCAASKLRGRVVG
eukprot:6181653-Pleurochrysis_carterae.AAC.1